MGAGTAPDDVTPHDVLTVIASWPADAVRSAVANMFARGGTADHPTAWHRLIPARHWPPTSGPPRRTTAHLVDSEDHYLEAINHPAGDLAQFWMNVVAHEWRAQTEHGPACLTSSGQSSTGWFRTSPGTALGPVLLSTRLRFFTGAIPAWAKSRLMPLFSWVWDTAVAFEVRGIWWSWKFGQYDDQILADGLLDAMLVTTRRATISTTTKPSLSLAASSRPSP